MNASTFTIDTFGDEAFDGFTQNDTWNGWARPYFTFEQAQRVVDAHRSHGRQAWYDLSQDAFIFEFSEDDVDIFTAEMVEGQKLYPIGAGCWVWESASQQVS